MHPSVELVRRPEARTDSVEDLVAAVMRGDVRIPVFQRGLEWESSHVLDLFDSIYRGFPIGSLLFQRAPAPAGPVRVGPLAIFGGESTAAFWVVDGQQRLTSLAAGLARSMPLPTSPADPFVVYFDPLEQTFRAPPRGAPIPATWVGLPHLLDAGTLTEWVFSWPHGRDAELRRVVFEAGRRLREYKVPLYIIEADDEQAVRAIFYRVNTSGRQLSWEAVHDALYAHKGARPSSLAELADEVAKVGMGRLHEERELLPCLVALRGLDAQRSLEEHLRSDLRVLAGAAAEAAPVLRAVLSFLRTEAEVPHLTLLPHFTPFLVLARFFRKHPAPAERTTTLLVRWLWRAFFTGQVRDSTWSARGIAAVTDDEEASVQTLLTLVRAEPAPRFRLPDGPAIVFDRSRLALLAMAAWRPRHLELSAMGDHGALDVAALIRGHRVVARPLFALTVEAMPSLANRLILPGQGPAAPELRAFIDEHGTDDEVLRSHGILPETAEAIIRDDHAAALSLRAKTLEGAVNDLGDRLAGWGRNDRPSIDYLLAQVGTE